VKQVIRYFLILVLLLLSNTQIAEVSEKKRNRSPRRGMMEIPYDASVGDQLFFYSKLVQLDALLHQMAEGNAEKGDEGAQLIDDVQQLAKKLGLESVVDWDAARNIFVGTRTTCTDGIDYLNQVVARQSQDYSNCHYLNDITAIQANMRQMLNLSNSLLSAAASCVDCMFIDSSDITGVTGITIDGTTTWPAGTYCLKETVTYTGAAAAITVATDDVTVDLRDNTILLTPSGASCDGVLVESNNVTVADGSVVRTNTTEGAAVHIYKSGGQPTGVTVSHMNFARQQTAYDANSHGLYAEGAKDVVARAVNATLNGQYGIYFESVEGGLIEDCIGLHNGGITGTGGAQFVFDSDGTSDDCTGVIRRNLSIKNQSYGVRIINTGSSDISALVEQNAIISDDNATSSYSSAVSASALQYVNNVGVGSGAAYSGYQNLDARYSTADLSGADPSLPFGTNLEAPI